MAESRARAGSYPAHEVGSYPVYEGGAFLEIKLQCTRGGFWEFARDFETLIPNQEKHGQHLVGAWRTLYGEQHEVSHLYEFRSMAAMERIRKRLFADARKLEEIKTDTSPNPPHYWVNESHNMIMVLLPYSPRVKPYQPELVIPYPAGMVGSYPAKGGRVYLHESVRLWRGGVWEYARHFEKALPMLEKHGLNFVAAWRNLYGGTSKEIINLYAFESLAEMESIRNSLYSDPVFLKHWAKDTSPNQPNYWSKGESTKVLVPLPYSPMK